MNKKQILIGLMLMAIPFLTSCQQDELLYSCDREVNKWATLNAEEIKSMTKSQFLDLDASYQRAAFNVFTAQHRMNLWKAKLEETLLLEWTEDERIHIENLLNMVVKNVEWFDSKRSQEVTDHFEIETYKWVDFAINNLQWDTGTIYAITHTLSAIFKENGKVFVVKSRDDTPVTWLDDGYLPFCSCHIGSWMSNVNCGEGKKCGEVECTEQSVGCGTFTMYPCDGRCVNK